MNSLKKKKRYKVKIPLGYLDISRKLMPSYRKVLFNKILNAYTAKQMEFAEKILIKGLASVSNKKKYIGKEKEIIQYLQELNDTGEIIDYCYNSETKKIKVGNNFIDGLYNCFYNSLMQNKNEIDDFINSL